MTGFGMAESPALEEEEGEKEGKTSENGIGCGFDAVFRSSDFPEQIVQIFQKRLFIKKC